MSTRLCVVALGLGGFLAALTASGQVICTAATCGSSGPQTIASVSLASNSFTGGAAQATNIGAITVTMSPASPAFSGTLSITGTQTGSGNDADSFQLSGSTLQTGGGTTQPGQYAINIVATQGGTTNGSLTQPETMSATGPGGAGWQLTFSDEFVCPNSMLECAAIVSASSFTWSSSFCTGLSAPSATGCGTLTVASLPANITSAACTGSKLGACDVSIAGATNGGAGGNAAVNGTFLVAGVPDSTHINLYMPYTGINASMGGTITVGSGPWAIALTSSCVSGPCTGLPLLASNDNAGESESFDPHACTVNGGIMAINLRNTNLYVPPASMQVGFTATSSMCHIQAWDGSRGFSQTEELYMDSYAAFPVGVPHAALWTLQSSNVWNSGPEIDWPECFGSCFDHVLSGIDTGTSGSTSLVQYGVDISNSTITFFQNGSSVNSGSNPFSGTTWYPIADVTVDSSGNSPTFPSTFSLEYVRVFKKVGANACYSSIPAHGTIPHTGTC
jgi:hypothetical protein